MRRTPDLTRLLAALGALPFIACALLPFAGITALPYLGTTGNVAAAYGLTIASFMAGVHWGIALMRQSGVPVNLFVTSNVVAVAAWLAFLLATLALTLLVLTVLFIYLLYVDFRLLHAGAIEDAYWRTRLWITVAVVVSLFLVAFTA